MFLSSAGSVIWPVLLPLAPVMQFISAIGMPKLCAVFTGSYVLASRRLFRNAGQSEIFSMFWQRVPIARMASDAKGTKLVLS
jgi:hypothetical protein